MTPKINFHYTIPFKKVSYFEWKKYNDVVDLTLYKERIMPKLTYIVDNLCKNLSSRQEVIIVNREGEFMSCLLSIQFQIVDECLILTSIYRSQCELSGRPCDTLMNQYLATTVMNMLRLKKYKIYVLVNNYHINPLSIIRLK